MSTIIADRLAARPLVAILAAWWLLVPSGAISAAVLLVETEDVSRPVWVDGTYAGLAPVRVDSLAAGPHRIQVGSRPGEAEWTLPWQVELDLMPEEVRRLSVPPLQRLHLVTSGRNLPVAIGGERKGWTPLQLLVPRGTQLEIAGGNELPRLYLAESAESTLVLPSAVEARRSPALVESGGKGRYLLPLGAVALGVLGVWARQTADGAYEDYLGTVDRDRMEKEFDRAARYDDLAAGFWVGAEVLLVASIWSWLRGSGDSGPHLERDPEGAEVRVGWRWGGDEP